MWKNTQKLEQFLSDPTLDLQKLLTSRDVDGNQPFMMAISTSNMELIKLLLKFKRYIDINAKDLESGYTVMHKALLKGEIKLAISLLREFTIDTKVRDHEGLTCLELLQVLIAYQGFNFSSYQGVRTEF